MRINTNPMMNLKSGIKLVAAVILATALVSCTSPVSKPETETAFPKLSGAYLGQVLPDSIPTLFAPGVVSTGMFTRDMAISPDGKEIFFCVALGNYTYATILFTRR